VASDARQPVDPSRAAPGERAADAVRRALADLEDAFQRRDVEAILARCSDEIVFFGSAVGEEAVGHAGVAAMLEALAPAAEGADFSLAWTDVDVDVDVRGDVALLTALGEATFTTAEATTSLRYRLSGALLRTGGRWLWRIYHGSEPAAW
jgi:ketosteroid isomerase-like protein